MGLYSADDLTEYGVYHDKLDAGGAPVRSANRARWLAGRVARPVSCANRHLGGPAPSGRMSLMADVLNVSLRTELGTKAVRRLRKAGQTPAVLYGHGEANVNLAIPAHEIRAVLRHGSQMVTLAGAVTEKALLKDVQWDTFSTHPLHVDLTRVSEQERVTVTVPLDLRGEAPGAKKGGVVDHLIYELEIECPAGQIPERLWINLNDLELGESIQADSVVLPDNVTLLTPESTVVAHCQTMGVVEEEEEEAPAPGASEPEVIGRKAEAEEEADS
jgi:large subunit ribosomal protein L25